MRADGMTGTAIAKALGVGKSTVYQWFSDPDGSLMRERRKKYRGECVECGASTYNGNVPPPERCSDCSRKRVGEQRTAAFKERAIARIREWAAIYGEPPAMPDWMPWRTENHLHDPERARVFREANGYWPSSEHVARQFGGWNVALIAAGFDPRPKHGGGGNELRRRSMREKAA